MSDIDQEIKQALVIARGIIDYLEHQSVDVRRKAEILGTLMHFISLTVGEKRGSKKPPRGVGFDIDTALVDAFRHEHDGKIRRTIKALWPEDSPEKWESVAKRHRAQRRLIKLVENGDPAAFLERGVLIAE